MVFPAPRQLRPLSCNHSKLEKKEVQLVRLAGRWEAGRPGGLTGNSPTPLWRRWQWNWLGRLGFRGTGLPRGGAW